MFTVLSEQRLRPLCASLAATYSQLYVQPLAQIPYFLSLSSGLRIPENENYHSCHILEYGIFIKASTYTNKSQVLYF